MVVCESVGGGGLPDATAAADPAPATDCDVVDPDNGRARAFYERHGFEPWGEVVARDLT